LNVHKQLWAPWRLAYVAPNLSATTPSEPAPRPADPPTEEEECFFCRAVAACADRENLVAHRGARTVTLLNRYPYNNGHLLVAPQRHEGRLEQLTDEEQIEILHDLARWVGVLQRLLRAEGFNVGLNLGRAAGAGVPDHLHWHIVPRWQGDTNFMPALAAVRVIPQSLDALWQLLVERP
jgi:ATP adenylyltransferase